MTNFPRLTPVRPNPERVRSLPARFAERDKQVGVGRGETDTMKPKPTAPAFLSAAEVRQRDVCRQQRQLLLVAFFTAGMAIISAGLIVMADRYFRGAP